jgi:ornithine carbamoyltransferase
MTDFLRVPDLGEKGLHQVLELAAAVKQQTAGSRGALSGGKVGLFFEKPSTRTRVSCEAACVDLGAHPVVLKNDEIGLGSREAVEDVARVLDRYLDALAFRVFDHRHLETIADYADSPVINLLSDRAHPCQAVADLQTIAENRPLEETVVAYVGDGNNVAHSLLLAGAMSGMHMRIAGPAGHAPSEEVVEEATMLAAESGGSVVVGADVRELVEGADVVYTDVWTSMGDEDEAGGRAELFAPYQVDEALFGLAEDDALFLHCLPAHRGEEVTEAVLEGERSVVFDQAENRMHAFKAILLYVTGWHAA